jgi:hypothetical protein
MKSMFASCADEQVRRQLEETWRWISGQIMWLKPDIQDILPASPLYYGRWFVVLAHYGDLWKKRYYLIFGRDDNDNVVRPVGYELPYDSLVEAEKEIAGMCSDWATYASLNEAYL